MSGELSFSWNSNLRRVPGGRGSSDLMKIPPLLMSEAYCSMNSSTVALLNLTLSETGARLDFRTSSAMKQILPRGGHFTPRYRRTTAKNERSINKYKPLSVGGISRCYGATMILARH